MYKIPENMTNKFEFVTLAAKRAEQLQQGARPRCVGATDKVTMVAQQEVAEGLVQLYNPESHTVEEEIEEE